MKPIFQSIVEKGKGDCQRACIASLFDLQLEQVPHFKLFGSEGKWFKPYRHFLLGIGYDFYGTSMGPRHSKKEDRNYKSINGFFLASVPSRTFEESGHSVIIDEEGFVVHDPNPNKRWLGVNVIETGELQHVDIIEQEREPQSCEEDPDKPTCHINEVCQICLRGK